MGISEIVPRVHISDLNSAQCRRTLSDYNITTIIALGCKPSFPSDSGLEYLSFPSFLDLEDYNILGIISKIQEFLHIAKKTGNLLFHCVYGSSRSAAACAAHLMENYNMSLETVHALLCEKRKEVAINVGFLRQLALFEAMQYELVGNSPVHAEYRLFRVAVHLQRGKSLVKSLASNICELQLARHVTHVKQENLFKFKCRLCGRILFNSNNVISQDSLRILPIVRQHPVLSEKQPIEHHSSFTMLVEPVDWIVTQIVDSSILEHELMVTWTSLKQRRSKRIDFCQDPNTTKVNECATENSDNKRGVLGSEGCVGPNRRETQPDIRSHVGDTMLQGKLLCPNPRCDNKIGSYQFNSGTCCVGKPLCVHPSFRIVTSRLDKVI